MKNKKGFLLRDIIIALVFMLGIFTLFILAIASVSDRDHYNRPDMTSEQFSKNFNKLNDIIYNSGGINDTRTSVNNPSGMQLQGNFDVAFSSTWTVFNLVWSAIDVYSGLSASIADQFVFIPREVIIILGLVLMTALIVFVVFSIISSILRGRI